MAQISIIKHSEILESHRFDAEYFKPEYLRTLNIIKKQDYLFNDKVSLIKSGTTPRDRDESLKEGVILLKTGNIRNNILIYEKESYFHISNEIDNRMHTTKLKENDVLLNIVGATTDVIGRVALVPGDFPKSNITQAMAFCRVNNPLIKPEYLFIFFQTKYGKNQTKRLARPTGQFNLNLQEVGQFLIPILENFFQVKITKMVNEAHQKLTQSKQLYKEAEWLLLEELELVNFRPKHSLTFETTKSKIEESLRFDSEFYQPKYDEIIKHIENYKNGFDIIKNIVKWNKGVEVGSEAYSDEGKDFIRVSDFSVNKVNSSNKKISEILFNKLKNNFQPKKDEILFTKDGTIGLSYLLKEDIEGVLSSAFLRLTTKDEYEHYNKEVLTLILNSVLCKMQIEQLSGGAIIAHLKPSDFDKFRIPLIEEHIQKEISIKLQKSHKLRKESNNLLEDAKKMVEGEIEKEAKKNG